MAINDGSRPRARFLRDAAPGARRQRHAGGRGGGAGAAGRFDGETLATGLGWFSVGLGLAELVAPGGVARLIGVPDDDRHRRTLQALGLRELASGVGILMQPQPAGWVWSRVAGDAMDLGLLGTAFASDRAQKGRVAAAAVAVAGVTLLDVICGGQLSQGKDRTGRGRGGFAAWFGGAAGDRAIHVTKAITIGRPAQELYRFWRDFENLPRVMEHLDAVRVMDGGRSRWRAKAPLGGTVEWDAEVTDDQPGRRLAWRSLPGAAVSSAGSVSFEAAPGKRGTIVRVELEYEPPGGAVGATFAKLFGKAPDQELQGDLRRFKQVMELGEIVQSDATAKGWGAGQPPAGTPRH